MNTGNDDPDQLHANEEHDAKHADRHKLAIDEFCPVPAKLENRCYHLQGDSVRAGVRACVRRNNSQTSSCP